MKTTPIIKTSILASLLFIGFHTQAAQFVFPAKGQSPEQQKTDEASCAEWAKGQVGADIAQMDAELAQLKAQVDAAQAPDAAKGARLKGALAGAAVGSHAGRDGLRNETAAAGALLGARSAKKGTEAAIAKAKADAKADLDAQYATKKADYLKATSVCLESKGYNVK